MQKKAGAVVEEEMTTLLKVVMMTTSDTHKLVSSLVATLRETKTRMLAVTIKRATETEGGKLRIESLRIRVSEDRVIYEITRSKGGGVKLSVVVNDNDEDNPEDGETRTFATLKTRRGGESKKLSSFMDTVAQLTPPFYRVLFKEVQVGETSSKIKMGRSAPQADQGQRPRA